VSKKQYRPKNTYSKDSKIVEKTDEPVTYASLLKTIVPKIEAKNHYVTKKSAPLVHLDYHEELRIKEKAFDLYWDHFKLPGKPAPLIASPMGRQYRTTSKRKTLHKGRILYLLFGDKALSTQKWPFVESPLEPPEHGRIYSFLQAKLSEPPYKLLATHLNYLIIRGSYSEQSVIFNVDALNGPLVRKLKMIAEHLKKLDKSITGAYIYTDPSSSDYYLEARQPVDLLNFKKLYGKGDVAVTHQKHRYRFHPTSFSQVNESMVPVMLEQARKLLDPGSNEVLIDLYCGYGLFSHYLAADYNQVLGIDGEGPSIRSAVANKKLNPASRKTKFLARWITENTIEDIQPFAASLTETVILDPPRQGPKDGVIAALCLREPHKVLHIHCGVDQIPSSIEQWQQGGYQVEKIVPMDMFPGTPNLEVLILLTPANS